MLTSIFINGNQKIECINHPKLSDLSISQLKYLINQKTNIPVTDQKLKFAGKFLSNTKMICDYPHIVNNSTIDLTVGLMGGSNKKLKSGKNGKNGKSGKNSKNSKNDKSGKGEAFINIGKIFRKVGKDIEGGVGGPLKSIEKFFTKDVAGFFTMIGDVVKWFFYLIIWLVVDLLNPLVWINDVILGAFVGLRLLFGGILDGLFSLVRELFNKILQPVAKGVWGNEYSDHSQSKCYKAPTCSVPYPILFATIILPPLGVFMELGLKGWLNILLCAVLTLIYYLPGLIYALILLYC
jgi:uncharacterized membrane protein YqaE (UPF0057 family)